jgi:predicted nucleic acid-binding protein
VKKHRERWRHSSGSALFVDTWGWIALANAREPRHAAVQSACARDEELGLARITTEYVLDETISRLFATFPFREAEAFCRGLFQAIQLGSVRNETITPARFEKAFELRLRYRDKPRISFTDLTSFVVMQELGLRRVLTEDAHFVQVGMDFERVP